MGSTSSNAYAPPPRAEQRPESQARPEYFPRPPAYRTATTTQASRSTSNVHPRPVTPPPAMPAYSVPRPVARTATTTQASRSTSSVHPRLVTQTVRNPAENPFTTEQRRVAPSPAMPAYFQVPPVARTATTTQASRSTMIPAERAGIAAFQINRNNQPDPPTDNRSHGRGLDYPITPGTSEVLIIGDCTIKDIRKFLPKEYKVFHYANATIGNICSKVKEAPVVGHVLQVVLNAGTFDLKSDMRITCGPFGYEKLIPEEFNTIKKDMRELIRYCHEKFPAATVFISAILQRKTINSDIFDEINVVLKELAEDISRDLRGVFQVVFFDGSPGIVPWRRLKDGIHLPYEMSEIYAKNLRDTLTVYRPLKGVEIVQTNEPEIRVANAINITIGDCVLKELRRFLSDDCRVFWYKGGTIDKIKEKVIAMPPARRVQRVILHVGTFDIKAFEGIFDQMMDQMIELVLICFDRFPKAKVLLSPILPRLDLSAQEVALKVNEFYQSLTTVFVNDFGVINVDSDILLENYEPDGIHLTESQARVFARQINTAFESN